MKRREKGEFFSGRQFVAINRIDYVEIKNNKEMGLSQLGISQRVVGL